MSEKKAFKPNILAILGTVAAISVVAACVIRTGEHVVRLKKEAELSQSYSNSDVALGFTVTNLPLNEETMTDKETLFMQDAVKSLVKEASLNDGLIANPVNLLMGDSASLFASHESEHHNHDYLAQSMGDCIYGVVGMSPISHDWASLKMGQNQWVTAPYFREAFGKNTHLKLLSTKGDLIYLSTLPNKYHPNGAGSEAHPFAVDARCFALLDLTVKRIRISAHENEPRAASTVEDGVKEFKASTPITTSSH